MKPSHKRKKKEKTFPLEPFAGKEKKKTKTLSQNMSGKKEGRPWVSLLSSRRQTEGSACVSKLTVGKTEARS